MKKEALILSIVLGVSIIAIIIASAVYYLNKRITTNKINQTPQTNIDGLDNVNSIQTGDNEVDQALNDINTQLDKISTDTSSSDLTLTDPTTNLQF